jgi:hypothetical protein
MDKLIPMASDIQHFEHLVSFCEQQFESLGSEKDSVFVPLFLAMASSQEELVFNVQLKFALKGYRLPAEVSFFFSHFYAFQLKEIMYFRLNKLCWKRVRLAIWTVT